MDREIKITLDEQEVKVLTALIQKNHPDSLFGDVQNLESPTDSDLARAFGLYILSDDYVLDMWGNYADEYNISDEDED